MNNNTHTSHSDNIVAINDNEIQNHPSIEVLIANAESFLRTWILTLDPGRARCPEELTSEVLYEIWEDTRQVLRLASDVIDPEVLHAAERTIMDRTYPAILLEHYRTKYADTVALSLKGVLGKRGQKLGANDSTLAELTARTWQMLYEWIVSFEVFTETKGVSVTKGVTLREVKECACIGPRCTCPCTCGNKDSKTGKGCTCEHSVKFWVYRLAARSFEEWRTERRKRDQSASNARRDARRKGIEVEDNDPSTVWDNGPRKKFSQFSASVIDTMESREEIEDHLEQMYIDALDQDSPIEVPIDVTRGEEPDFDLNGDNLGKDKPKPKPRKVKDTIGKRALSLRPGESLAMGMATLRNVPVLPTPRNLEPGKTLCGCYVGKSPTTRVECHCPPDSSKYIVPATLEAWKWKPPVAIRVATEKEWSDWTNPLTGGFSQCGGKPLSGRPRFEDVGAGESTREEHEPTGTKVGKVLDPEWAYHREFGRVKFFRVLDNGKEAFVTKTNDGPRLLVLMSDLQSNPWLKVVKAKKKPKTAKTLEKSLVLTA